MSLGSLLLQDNMTVGEPTIGRDSSGGPTHTPYTLRFNGAVVSCRWDSPTGQQKLMWLQLAIDITWVIYTEQDGIENGDICISSDGIQARVKSITRNRAIGGGIPSYYVLEAEQIRQS